MYWIRESSDEWIRSAAVPLGPDGVDLVDENDGGCVFLSHSEKLTHQFGSVAQVLLDQLRTHHTQERRWRLIGYCFGQKGFPWSEGLIRGAV